MTQSMLAGVLHGLRDLRAERVSRPALPPDHVLLRIRRAGICGSDVHYFIHGRCGGFVPTQPFILGHEVVAVVEEIGPAVERPIKGERVVVNPAASCGQCEFCKSGRGNLCRHVVMLGSASTTPPTNGAFAEYISVPSHQCYALPASVDDCLGAMIEPLSVALHAIGRAGGVVGARVMVAGGGPIGLITALAARALGATLVVVGEPTESRRNVAASLGVDHALDPSDGQFARQALSISDDGFDAVFEASGAVSAIRGTLDVVRRGGTIVQVGTLGSGDVPLPINDLMVRELKLLGSFRYVNEFSEAIRLVSARRITLDALVTSLYPLSDIPIALESASGDKSQLKVQIVVPD